MPCLALCKRTCNACKPRFGIRRLIWMCRSQEAATADRKHKQELLTVQMQLSDMSQQLNRIQAAASSSKELAKAQEECRAKDVTIAELKCAIFGAACTCMHDLVAQRLQQMTAVLQLSWLPNGGMVHVLGHSKSMPAAALITNV